MLAFDQTKDKEGFCYHFKKIQLHQNNGGLKWALLGMERYAPLLAAFHTNILNDIVVCNDQEPRVHRRWGHVPTKQPTALKRHNIAGDNDNLPTNQRHQHSSQNNTSGQTIEALIQKFPKSQVLWGNTAIQRPCRASGVRNLFLHHLSSYTQQYTGFIVTLRARISGFIYQ